MDHLIITNRLRIRAINANDAQSIFELRSAPETFKYVEIEPYKEIARAERFIKAVLKDIEEKEAFFWCVDILKENRPDYEFAGTICLWNFSEDRKVAEVGYELLPKFYGKGIATEALDHILDFVKKHFEFKEIHAITHEENLPSIRLLNRLNFERLGIAIEIDPEIEEPLEMIMYTYRIMRD